MEDVIGFAKHIWFVENFQLFFFFKEKEEKEEEGRGKVI